jgi:predicted ATPase
MNGSDLEGVLRNLLEHAQLEPYIRYIRFPRYKSLEPNSRIDFSFPLTVLIGANGSNKSSLLHALYGCPKDMSTGDFWFSTDLDPIVETGERSRNCYIYSYRNEAAGKNVEVLKTRIRYSKKSRNNGNGQRGKIENPDYWEPSRPIKSYGMSPLEEEDKKHSSLKTRWDTIEKNVLYMDFRSELNPFDKYFYFGSLKRTKTLRSKQDRLRTWAKRLKNAALRDAGRSDEKNARLRRSEALSEEALIAISQILGRKYLSITCMEHRFYNNGWGISYLFQSPDLRYSEAFAGSGEYSAARVVSEILSTNDKSLILLDEPETSLHPGAQKRLVQFLLEQIKLKKHQIILSTHSPAFLEGLPSDAIKAFRSYEASVRIFNAISAKEAFCFVEQSVDKTPIIVEDSLSKLFAERSLGKHQEDILKLIHIEATESGATSILKTHLTAAIEGHLTELILLDGDMLPSPEDIRLLESATSLTFEEQAGLIERLTKCKARSFLYGSISEKDRKKREIRHNQFFDFWKRNVLFLPFRFPEEKLWLEVLRETGLGEAGVDANSDYFKDRLVAYAAETFGKEAGTAVSGEEISVLYQLLLTRILKSEHDDFSKEIANIITERVRALE